MHARARLLVLDTFESLGHAGFLRGRDHLVGHREEDVIFLLDVLAEQGGIAAGVGDHLMRA